MSALATPALLVLAPLSAVIRGWQAWRRGRDWRLEVTRAPAAGGPVALDVRADIPYASSGSFRTLLTDTLVRVAEAIRRPDDVYHLYYRVPGDDEGVLLPVGPRIQELGERLALALGQNELERRTALWLTLPAGRSVAGVIDPHRDDPEAPGEPLGLIARSEARWAMAVSWARSGPATRYRVLLRVSESDANAVVAALRPLTE